MAKVKKWKGAFTTAPNALAFDKRLSWKARGIFLYMQAKPDNWDFSSDRMSEDSTEGLTSTRNGLRELIEFGYLSAKKLQNGKMEYELQEPTLQHESSQSEKTAQREKPTEGKTHSAKTSPITNKDIKQIKNIYNKQEQKIEFLESLPDDFVEELTMKFDITRSKVRQTAEKVIDYCKSTGKRYKDYKATLRNWIRKEYPERVIKPTVAEERKPDDPEVSKLIKELGNKLRYS